MEPIASPAAAEEVQDLDELALSLAATEISSPVQKQTPRYAQQTAAQSVQHYANQEQDIIRQSFQTGNYRLIQNLPNDLRANQIVEATSQHIDANITTTLKPAPHKRVTGLFSEFEYIPSPYSAADEAIKQQAYASRQRRVGHKDFIYSSTNPQRPPISPEDQDTVYADPYEEAENARLRELWLQKSRILSGPMVVPQAAKPLSQGQGVNKANLPLLVRTLEKEIRKDWEECDFEVYVDSESLVILKFDLSTLDHPEGLQAYLSVTASSNPLILDNRLTKIVELWNHDPGDGCLYFAFKPPFVKRPPLESFYTIHPEHKSYQTLRAHHASEQSARERLKAEEEARASEAAKESLQHQVLQVQLQQLEYMGQELGMNLKAEDGSLASTAQIMLQRQMEEREFQQFKANKLKQAIKAQNDDKKQS